MWYFIKLRQITRNMENIPKYTVMQFSLHKSGTYKGNPRGYPGI